jgi:hypothetical protein
MTTVIKKPEVLNKLLYGRLTELFSSVKIAKQGELLDISAKDLNQINIFNLGETYRVNCIFCRRYNYYDTNHHLWISYAWGTRQLSSFGYNFGIKCFRHDCLKDKKNLQTFYETIYGDFNTPDVLTRQTFLGDLENFKVFNEDEKIIPINEKFIFDEIYNHKDSDAYKYLLKKFKTEENILKICNKFSIKLCVDVKSEDLSDKYKLYNIYIPIEDLDGKVRCEQWRSFNSKTKYFSGNNISRYIYNFNSVKEEDEIFFVEGPADVWRLFLDGYAAVCCFGKSLSYEQRSILEKYFGLFSTNYSEDELTDKKFIVVLDGDVKDFEILKYCRALKRRVLGKVYLVNLPNNLDPADLDDLSHYFSSKVEFID